MKGHGFFDDVDKFFRDSHLLSNIGSVALPAAGAALGSFLDPFIGPAGTVLGGVIGNSANDLIKSRGYGAGEVTLGLPLQGGGGGDAGWPPARGNFILASGMPFDIKASNVDFPYVYGQSDTIIPRAYYNRI
jgi:hypothetical protein